MRHQISLRLLNRLPIVAFKLPRHPAPNFLDDIGLHQVMQGSWNPPIEIRSGSPAGLWVQPFVLHRLDADLVSPDGATLSQHVTAMRSLAPDDFENLIKLRDRKLFGHNWLWIQESHFDIF